MFFSRLVISFQGDFEKAFNIFDQMTPSRMGFMNAAFDIMRNVQITRTWEDDFVNEFHIPKGVPSWPTQQRLP